ncbi:hypothetical protein ACJX0J_036426, partial [Zea mays]
GLICTTRLHNALHLMWHDTLCKVFPLLIFVETKNYDWDYHPGAAKLLALNLPSTSTIGHECFPIKGMGRGKIGPRGNILYLCACCHNGSYLLFIVRSFTHHIILHEGILVHFTMFGLFPFQILVCLQDVCFYSVCEQQEIIGENGSYLFNSNIVASISNPFLVFSTVYRQQKIELDLEPPLKIQVFGLIILTNAFLIQATQL